MGSLGAHSKTETPTGQIIEHPIYDALVSEMGDPHEISVLAQRAIYEIGVQAHGARQTKPRKRRDNSG